MNIQEKKTLRRPVRSSALFFAFTLLTRAVALLTTPVFTRMLTPTEYAVIPLYLTWHTLFSSLITLELTGSVLLAVMAKHKEKIDAILSSTLSLCLLSLLFFFGIYLAVAPQIESFTGLSRPLMLLLFLHTAASLPLTLYSAKAKYLYRPERTFFLLIVTSVAAPLLGIVLLIFTRAGALSRILATVICTLAVAIPLGIHLIRQGRTLVSLPLFRELLRRGLPLFPHYVALSAMGELGRLFVSRYSTPDALSKLGIAATIAHGVTMLTGAINAAFFPWLLRRLRRGERERVRRMSSTVIYTVLLVTLAVSLLAPEAIALLAPVEYRGATEAILPLLFATFPAFLYTLFAGVTLYRERTLAMTVATLVSASIGVLSQLYLVPRYSYVGAAYATALSYLTLALSHLIVCAQGEKGQWHTSALFPVHPDHRMRDGKLKRTSPLFPRVSRANTCAQPILGREEGNILSAYRQESRVSNLPCATKDEKEIRAPLARPLNQKDNLPAPLLTILLSLALSALSMLLIPPLFSRPLLRYLLLIPTALALFLILYRRRTEITEARRPKEPQ